MTILDRFTKIVQLREGLLVLIQREALSLNVFAKLLLGIYRGGLLGIHGKHIAHHFGWIDKPPLRALIRPSAALFCGVEIGTRTYATGWLWGPFVEIVIRSLNLDTYLQFYYMVCGAA